MITLKKYLDSPLIGSEDLASPEKETILPAVLAAYGFALLEMGDCSVVAIPALGDDLKQSFARLQARLSVNMSCDAVRVTGQNVQENLREWGKRTALHYQQKTHEVRELLFVMARSTNPVYDGARERADQQEAVCIRGPLAIIIRASAPGARLSCACTWRRRRGRAGPSWPRRADAPRGRSKPPTRSSRPRLFRR